MRFCRRPSTWKSRDLKEETTDKSRGHMLTYAYNSNGTIATQKDANGNLTSITLPELHKHDDRWQHPYSYDNLDRSLKLTYNNGTGMVTYT